MGEQGNVFSIGGCQITDRFSIGIGGSTAICLAIPAGKGVAFFGVAVDGQADCLIVGHALVCHVSAIGGVAIKLYSVLMRFPLGKQRYNIPFDICQVFDAFTVGVGGSTAIRLSVPAGKGIACPGIGIVCQVGCNVKGHWLVTHTAAVRCIAVIFDGIVVDSPLSIQGYRIAIYICQICYILTIAIGSSRTVGLGIPASKGVSSFGVAIGHQTGLCIIGHALIICTAAIRCVTVKLYRVSVRSPESVKSIVVFINCDNIICSIRMTGTITFGIP